MQVEQPQDAQMEHMQEGEEEMHEVGFLLLLLVVLLSLTVVVGLV